ncbi:MAG: redox-sensing transcriptional repressor Rex [Actinomycetota bacterium]|nr:redox-sensing transcriptional repressor Rex [Actinomycetota bacterium]
MARLPVYLQCLRELPTTGQTTVSSDQLAAMAGVNPAKVRKDLSYLGSYGLRGVGYDLEHLRSEVERALGLASDWPVIIVGVGNLGSALANYGGFNERGFQVVGLFDVDPRKVGRRVDGLVVERLDQLEEAVRQRGVAIAIIATPAHAAQEVANRLSASGVQSILNFAPAVLQVPKEVELRQVDLSTELQILSFYLAQARRRLPGGRLPRGG